MLLTLVATMTLFVAESDIAYAQASPDATLSTLEVVGQPTTTTTPPTGVMYSELSPTLDDDAGDGLITEYNVRIPFDQTGVTVTPDVVPGNKGNDIAAENSIIRVNGTVVAAEAGHEVSLANGAGRTTNITIVVTAPLRSVTETYTIKVYRELRTRSDNADLASLRVSGSSLSPSFSAGTNMYNARVQSDKVTISYRLSDTGGGASVGEITQTGVGTPDQAKKEVTLGDEASTTTITIPVTAEDGSENSYTIAVYRIRANRETNANLATLSLAAFPGGGTGVRVGDALSLDTDHEDGTTTDYRERMDNATTHVTIAATVADPGATFVISPSDARPGAEDEGHQVALRAGSETTITVTVKAEDTARRQTYTVKVYRERATASTDNNLASLRLSAGTLTPAFSRSEQTYTTQVAANVAEVTVSYTASDTAGGSSVVVGTASTDACNNPQTVTGDVPLAVGVSTYICVTVTPEIGVAMNKVYAITVYRLRSLPSADARLATLTVNQGQDTFAPAFTAGTNDRMFDVKVEHNISAITVTATAAAAVNGATVAMTPNGGSNVALAAGAKTAIRITVTAEDRTTTDTYMVNVYRERAELSDDATLSALMLSAGTLSPPFMSDTIEYRARVANAIDMVTVSRTLNDNAGGATAAAATSTDDDCSTVDNNEDVSGDVSLNAGVNTYICVTATAEDDSTETYMITVYRLRANANTDAELTEFTIAEATGTINITDGTETDPETTLDLLLDENVDPDVAYRVRQITVDTTADIGAIVTITPTDADTGETGHQVDLTAGAETTIMVRVMPEDPAAQSKTFTSNVYRKNVPGSESDDATLTKLMLSGAVLTPEFASGTMEYEAAAAHSTEMTTVTAIANHIGAQSSVAIGTMSGETFAPGTDADMEMDGWQVSLTVGQEEAIAVQVTAEDGTTMETYTVTVTRAEEDTTLLSMYDADSDGQIDKTEALAAINDYLFNETITKDQMIAVINLYLFS